MPDQLRRVQDFKALRLTASSKLHLVPCGFTSTNSDLLFALFYHATPYIPLLFPESFGHDVYSMARTGGNLKLDGHSRRYS